MLVLLFSLFLSDSILPFPLKALQLDWSFSLTKSSGPYGEPMDYSVRRLVRSSRMKSNSSVRFLIKSSKPLGNQLFHFNLTNDEIEVFDRDLSTIARMKAFWADSATVFVRGISSDQRYAISGLLSPTQHSIVTITATDSDEVTVIRASPPQNVTAANLIQRILPAVAIVFFIGFGRPFQKRFWAQYRQMNTRSLQNRMRETQDRAKKTGKL
jgi:hypothetical protein